MVRPLGTSTKSHTSISEYLGLSETKIKLLTPDSGELELIGCELSIHSLGLYDPERVRKRDRNDGYGKSWVWVPDNDSALVRALLATRRLTVSTEGRYLLDIAGFTPSPEGFEEHFCKRVAQGLASQFQVNATYLTVRGSKSCDGIPFYTDFLDHDHPFYNGTKIHE